MLVCTAKIQNPQDTILEVTITLPFVEWRRVLDMLRAVPPEHAKPPLWPVISALQKTMAAVEKRATETVEGLGDG